MNKVSYTIKIDPKIVNRIKKFCLEHGIKQGFFVEKALREQLDREGLNEDLIDLKSLRSQEEAAITHEKYLKKRSQPHKKTSTAYKVKSAVNPTFLSHKKVWGSR